MSEVVVDGLTALTGGPCNDMAVDAQGRAWIGEFGYDYGAAVSTASLVRAIWVADLIGRQVLRVAEGGEVLQVIPAGERLTALAAALGGEDGRTLFVCAAAPVGDGDPATQRRGCIVAHRVEVPAA